MQQKDRYKEKVGGRPAKLNEKKKQRRHYSSWNCSGGDKMRNASGHQSKVNTYDISSRKRVTKVSGNFTFYSRAKQRQRNVQKKCAASAKLLFC